MSAAGKVIGPERGGEGPPSLLRSPTRSPTVPTQSVEEAAYRPPQRAGDQHEDEEPEFAGEEEHQHRGSVVLVAGPLLSSSSSGLQRWAGSWRLTCGRRLRRGARRRACGSAR